jgi:hypothetical protein
LDAGTAAGLGLVEFRTLVAVVQLTAMYSKLRDTTTTREVTEMVYYGRTVTGFDRRKVGEALRRLAELGLIERDMIGKGRDALILVGLVHVTESAALGGPLTGESAALGGPLTAAGARHT